MADTRTIRERQAAADALLDRTAEATRDCAAAEVVQATAVGQYPATAASFFACSLCDVQGDEAEGAAATYVPRDGAPPILALNLGTQVPPRGTTLIAHGVGGRWCFRYDG